MVTAPVAGRPSAPVTVSRTAALVCPPRSLVVTDIDVSVDTFCALAAKGSTSIANAVPSPATNSSRRLRRFMPLTCTCSKSPEELRIAKLRATRSLKRRRLLYLARARWGQLAHFDLPWNATPRRPGKPELAAAIKSPPKIGRGAAGLESPRRPLVPFLYLTPNLGCGNLNCGLRRPRAGTRADSAPF